MASMKEKATAKLEQIREKHPGVNHAILMVKHYGTAEGNVQAGAVTFFGFLSFFPILALAFFLIGILSQVFPEIRAEIAAEIGNLLPGVIGDDEGEIPLSTFEDYAGRVGIIGLFGVLYSGLGWLSGMRNALENMFVMPKQAQPNFLVGKARDAAALGLIGVTLIVSVALSGLVSGFSERVLTWLGFDPNSLAPNALLWLLAHGLAVAASTVLLLTMFRLLARPHLPRPALVKGAVLGAIGFELLKGLAGILIAQTKGQPAFQAFGVALILLVWINYFSRLVMLAAAFAYTAPSAVEKRANEERRAPAAPFQDEERLEANLRSAPAHQLDVAPQLGSDAGAKPELGDPDRPGARTSAGPRGRALALGSAVAVAGVVAVAARRRGRMSR